MDNIKSTIRAYQSILQNYQFNQTGKFDEDFASARFLKKMEKPNSENKSRLDIECWEQFIEFDRQLPSSLNLPSGEWYKARNLLHSWLRGDFRRSSVDFPKGSSFFPTKGLNSIESRLSRGRWSCTPENFDEFSRLVYSHKALKRAFRRRYTHWFRNLKAKESFKESERILWKHFGPLKNGPYLAFQWKLERITSFVRGSRFSTVPKNNKVSRPINIEPFGNILTQRQLGNFFRDSLKKQGINLDRLADEHRVRIKDPNVATIDLSNASDSNSIALIEFLFPKNIVKQIHATRSSMLLGQDGDYHLLKKVSSMGNGFTFELMTMLLTAVGRVLDPSCTVFGDDIIIDKKCAPRLIQLLEETGWVVNKDKSFLTGPFRESCGANWHDDLGYIKSFDFLYPENIADCALVFNKCVALQDYPQFKKLKDRLLNVTPRSLRGPSFEEGCVKTYFSDTGEHEDFPIYFACESKGTPLKGNAQIRKTKLDYQIEEIRSVVYFEFIPSLASKTVTDLQPKWHWGKYEMYLFSCRRSEDSVTGVGRWAVKKGYSFDGRFRPQLSPRSLERDEKE